MQVSEKVADRLLMNYMYMRMLVLMHIHVGYFSLFLSTHYKHAKVAW